MSLINDLTLDRPGEPGTWRLRIETLIPTGNVTKRMHFRVYGQLMQTLYWQVRSADGFLAISRPHGTRWLIVLRHSPRTPDRDNAYFSAKPLIDILRPMKIESGIYGPGTKKAGQPWRRERIGHGLILEDDPEHLEYWVRTVRPKKGDTTHTELILSDYPLDPHAIC